MKYFKKLVTSLIFVSLSGHATDFAPDTRLNTAIYAADAKSAEQLFQELTGTDNNQQFWRAFLAYRIAPVYSQSDRAKAIQYLDECIKHSDALAADSPRKAEAMAFAALCYGQKIGYYPQLAPALGSAAMAAKDTALAFGPDNPHVRLLLAINNLFTPTQWGGNPQHAQQELQTLAGQLQADTNWQWLLPDVHAYLAMAYGRRNEHAKASAALEQAKTLAPHYSFLNNVIEPYLLKKQQISKN